MQIFVRTAIMPSRTATATPSSMARTRPAARPAAVTHTTSNGTITNNASVHAGTAGRTRPSRGWPTSTKTVSAPVNSVAQPHWTALMRWWQSRALKGNANNSDETSSGWMSSRDPCASATA
ncbi:hypothetical protein A5773_04370 [Mycobacterium sp. 852014-52450_SCH5900713]|nr:hypothetical protein A5773_04370 [Mycobacterium sp. 852014-52450_SCH5900713]